MISTVVIMTLAMTGVFSAPPDDSSAALDEFALGNRRFTAAVYKVIIVIQTGIFFNNMITD